MIKENYEVRSLPERTTLEILTISQFIADQLTDGHLTILRFTTNWRVGLGTPYEESIREYIEKYTHSGSTLKSALIKLINSNIDNL